MYVNDIIYLFYFIIISSFQFKMEVLGKGGGKGGGGEGRDIKSILLRPIYKIFPAPFPPDKKVKILHSLIESIKAYMYLNSDTNLNIHTTIHHNKSKCYCYAS